MTRPSRAWLLGAAAIAAAVLLFVAFGGLRSLAGGTGGAHLAMPTPAIIAFAALPEAERREALRRVITSIDNPCPEVIRTYDQGGHATGEFWDAACSNGRAYSVLLHADAAGSTSVLDCAVLHEKAHVDCFVPFP
jgi:hypothetical protein